MKATILPSRDVGHSTRVPEVGLWTREERDVRALKITRLSNLE